MEQKEQGKEQQKFVKVIFDTYEECNDGKGVITWRKVVKSTQVPFSIKTTQWNKMNSYLENMEAMIFDIMDNGFLYISNTIAISVVDIHQFIACENVEQKQPEKNNQNNQKPNNFNDMRSGSGRKKHRPNFLNRDAPKQENKVEVTNMVDNSVTQVDITPILPENLIPKEIEESRLNKAQEDNPT